jgi:triacylglycerol lipase
MLPHADGSIIVGAADCLLNGSIAAYREHADAIRALPTQRGKDMLESTSWQCIGQTIIDFAFRRLQPYFAKDINQVANEESPKSIFELQKLGNAKPGAPVLINIGRYDPLVPYTTAVQLSRDWCAMGADVEFRTNDGPPFLNKAVVNHGLPMLVDGGPAMRWIVARFQRRTHHAQLRRVSAPLGGGPLP